MMRHRMTAILAATALAAALGCRPAHEDGAEAERADEHAALAPGPEGAARNGIETAVAEAAEGTTTISAFGRVLDPLPLVEALHARDAARAVAAAARTESERVERLHRDAENASARDVEAARTALAKATTDLADATARLHLAWGPLAATEDALVDDLVAGRAALVRVDVPAGVTVSPPPTEVTITDGRARTARVVGPAPTTDAQLQGEGWLALLTDEPPRPGAVVGVTVRRNAPLSGVAVPAGAVVWVDAAPAVYAEPTGGTYERRTVTLGPRLDGRWLVTAGVGAGERIVVRGAARLLSAEIAAAAPESD